jgi:hypothetical protein
MVNCHVRQSTDLGERCDCELLEAAGLSGACLASDNEQTGGGGGNRILFTRKP